VGEVQDARGGVAEGVCIESAASLASLQEAFSRNNKVGHTCIATIIKGSTTIKAGHIYITTIIKERMSMK
jgi:hypothetical protein